MASILEKPISTGEKVNRLMAIESEKKNAEVCDYVVEFTTVEQTADKILEGLRG